MIAELVCGSNLQLDHTLVAFLARPGDSTQGATFEAEGDLERTRSDVEAFRAGIQAKHDGLRRDLAQVHDGGGKAVLWGSGSKAVSYLTTLGIKDELEYVVDINPHKHGKFLAGSGQEIVSPEFLREYRPDAVIVMNPIYLDEIRRDLEGLGVSARVWAV